MAVFTSIRTTVNSKDEQFFKALGARVAQARKARNLTQHQLCAQLGIAQQTLANYEVGTTRFPASMLPPLAQILGMTLNELMGQESPKGKRGPLPRLQQQIDRIRELPKTKQHAVMEVLDMVLASQTGH
ncbi:MAG: helix-turn-helix transcriptional regulator [Acidobacteriota bacterium]|jgi:transcriptional regulator with XRE-family HTH domain|nr:helix-turn-helix transcriptional regulator [Acidobacteriota bacterium]